MNCTDINRLFTVICIYTYIIFIILYRRVNSLDAQFDALSRESQKDGGTQPATGPADKSNKTRAANADGVHKRRRGGVIPPEKPGARSQNAQSANSVAVIPPDKLWQTRFIILAAVALFARIAFCAAIEGFPTDMGCFKGWSMYAAENFLAIYDGNNNMFIDYPPGYMYVLLALGKIREFFDIPVYSGLYTALIKLPSILADIFCGIIVYRLTGREDVRAVCKKIMSFGRRKGAAPSQGGEYPAFSERSRLLAAAFFFFNPSVYFVSAIWGQVDSVMTLFILLAITMFLGDRFCLSGVFYALAVLQKPQGIIFLPVVFFMLLRRFIADKNIMPALKMASAAFGATALTILPFSLRHGPKWIVNLYLNTLKGYELASMNAFNFPALIGGNWAKDTAIPFIFSFSQWGMISIVAFTLLTGFFVFYAVGKRGASEEYAMFMGSALLIYSVVTYGPRMHERYFYPAMPLLLIAWILYRRNRGGAKAEKVENVEKDKKNAAAIPNGIFPAPGLKPVCMLLLYAWITFFGFLNILFVFSVYYTDTGENFYGNGWIYVISFMNVAASALIWIFAFWSVNAGKARMRPAANRRAPKKAMGRIASMTIFFGVFMALFMSQTVISDANSPYAGDVALSDGIAGGRPLAINNPGFEEGVESDAKLDGVPGWSIYNYREDWANEPGVSSISFDTGNPHTGAASIRIENYTINDVRLYQKIAVEPNSYYKISCMVKTDSVDSHGAGAAVSIIGINTISYGLKGTNRDFTEAVLYGKTGAAQCELEFAVGLGGYSSESTGIAWFDDVVVEKIENVPGEETVYSFENDTAPQDTGSGGNQPNSMSDGARVMLALAVLIVLAALALIALNITNGKGKRREAGPEIPQTDATGTGNAGLDKNDAIVMLCMTAVYAAMTLIRLGGFIAPQTYWKPAGMTDTVVFEFETPVNVRKIKFNCNAVQNNDFDSEFALYAHAGDTPGGGASGPDGAADAAADAADAAGDDSWRYIYAIKDVAFYEWKTAYIDAPDTKYIRMMPVVKSGISFNEIAFFGESPSGRDELLPVKINYDMSYLAEGGAGRAANLIDEQSIVPERPDVMNGTYFDEIYFARTAYENLHSLPIYEITHPPLGKLIISIGILLFGMNPFGWRIIGALAGAAMIPVMYAFGKKMFRKRIYAFFASFLLMFDFMHFTQTRISSVDSFTVLSIMLMYLFMLDSYLNGIHGRPLRDVLLPLALSGIAFGFGVSSKWIALYAGAGIAFIFLLGRIHEIRTVYYGGGAGRNFPSASRANAKEIARTAKRQYDYLKRLYIVLAACVLFFVIIPGTIYMYSYIPYLKHNDTAYGLSGIMMNNQKYMLDYHGKLTDTHPFESIWWHWPLDIKPIWYYSASGLPASQQADIVNFGNPLIWWTGAVCMIAAFILAYRRADRGMALIFIAFIFQYAPWIFIARATFIYHYFSAVPFMILAIVYIMRELLETKVISYRIAGAYLAAVALAFALYYPIISGLPVAKEYSRGLRIFSTWIW